MPEVDSLAGGVSGQPGTLRVGEDRTGRAEGEVHIVGQEHHAPVRVGVVHAVVLAVGTRIVARSREDGVGHAAQPSIDVHHLLEPVLEGRSALAEFLVVGDDGPEVVGLPIVFLQEEPAVLFLVVAEVAHRGARHPIGIRALVAVRVRVVGRVEQLVLVEVAVRTILELGVEQHVIVARHLQDGGTGMLVLRGEHLDEIIVAADHSAGVSDHEIEEDFELPLTDSFGAINRHRLVNSAVELVVAEAHIVSDPVVLVARALTSLEAEAHVVIDVLFAVDDGRSDSIIAHDLDRLVDEIALRIGDHDAKIVLTVGGRESVIDLEKGAGLWAGGRKVRGRSKAVGSLEIELHQGCCSPPGNSPLVDSTRAHAHGDILESASVHRVKHLHAQDVVRIGRARANGHRLPHRGHGRGMNRLRDGRANVALGARVGCGGGAHVLRPLNEGDPGEAVEVEPGMELVRAAHPARAKADRIVLAVADWAEQGGLDLIVHMPSAPGSHQSEHLVPRIVRIIDDLTVPVGSPEAPAGRAAAEGRVAELVEGTVFDDPQIVDQDFPRIEETQIELTPLAIGPAARGGGALEGVAPPSSLCRLITGGPRFGDAVVGVEIAQLETRTPTIRDLGPAPAVEVSHFVHWIFVLIAEVDALSGAREAAPEFSQDPGPGVGLREG